MAQKGGGQLLRRNAAAVVGDADVGQAAVLDLRHDGGGPGVDGVLQQLFDDAGGTFHHFSGGNQVRHMGRQALNLRHGSSLLGVIVSLRGAKRRGNPFLLIRK